MTRKLLIVLGATIAMLASSMSVASAQTTTSCGVAPAGYNVIESNARYIIGTTGQDFICAGDGVNTIRAKGKNDIIYAGGGNDIIFGGYGNDLIFGGDGDDKITAGGGADIVNAQAGDDTVLGGQGHDKINGNAGKDHLTGGDGNDTINGNADDDTLIGNKGWDILNGGNGNDTIFGGKGNDTINGGQGDDIVNGGEHDDTILGGSGNDQLRGSLGDDSIDGGDGADAVVGGDGQDDLKGGDGDDTMHGGNGDDTVDGGEGVDTTVPTEGDEDNCINPDSEAGCDLVDGVVPYPGRLTLGVPTEYSGGSAYNLTGWYWTSETVSVEWSAGGDFGPYEQPQPVNNPIDEDDGARFFGVSLDYSGFEASEPTVTDETAGVSRTVERAIDGYEVDTENETVTVFGTPGKTATVQFLDQGRQVFDEQDIVLTADGVEVGYSDTSELVWSLSLAHEDSDGDLEVHSIIWSRPFIQAAYQSNWVRLANNKPGGVNSNFVWESNGEVVESIPELTYSARLDGVPAAGDVISVTLAGQPKSITIPEFAMTTSNYGSTMAGTGTPGDTIYLELYIERGIINIPIRPGGPEFGSPLQLGDGDGEFPEEEEEEEVDLPPFRLNETTTVDAEGVWSFEIGEIENELYRMGEVGVVDADGDRYYLSFGEF